MKRRRFIRNIAGLGALSVLASEKLFSKTMAEPQTWHIEQFKDAGLAHFSYAVLVDGKIIIIDPARDARPYYDFAKKNSAKIIGVIETHPHADFASSHLEIHKSQNAAIYASSLTKPNYPFTPFDDGNLIKLTDTVSLRSLFTPGHAPDHVSAVLQANGKDIAVFSGDSLLIGDVGRPDLRDYSNNVQSQRQKLAAQMYHTVHEKFAKLNDDVVVYPAHGAGSLCGRAIRDASSSTIGYEKANNYAFEKRSEAEFVAILLKDQPFIPKYFPYDVALNIQGVPDLIEGTSNLQILKDNFRPAADALVIDGRSEAVFKNSYLSKAINIQLGSKFETWLGSVVAPDAKFYLIGGTDDEVSQLIEKTTKIGYETNIKGAFVYDETNGNKFAAFNRATFVPDDGKYTIIDVRTVKEVKEERIFKKAINIPLQDLSSRIKEIPTNKPILVNCASGYRSAAGLSIIKKYLPAQEVFDLGTSVSQYMDKPEGSSTKK